MWEFVRPKRKRDVRSFLGLAGYYRHFIAHFSTIAAPLTAATKKDLPDVLQWTGNMQQAFDELKRALISELILAGSIFTLPFQLHTDASDLGVGAVLNQTSPELGYRPVAYFSHQLLPR